MEFEIGDQDQVDGEEALFDESTNPSLRPEPDPCRPLWSWATAPGEVRELQRAELIPEEEQQLA